MGKIYMTDPIWFSPMMVLDHGEILIKSITTKAELNNKRFRKVIEAYTVAQMLVGVMLKENKEYWMQLVEDRFESPDIRTIRYSNKHSTKFDEMVQIDVEVVEYESHAKMPIAEFIVNKKFSKNKSYDENTVILCHVGPSVPQANLPTKNEINKALSEVKSPCQILFMAGTKPDSTIISLFSLKPRPGLILQYDPMFELSKLNLKEKLKKVVNFQRGTRRPNEYNANDKHYPFEKLGYIPNSDGSYKV